MVNKELLSQDDQLSYWEAASVIITRLFKPSNTHFIPVATLSEILGLHRDVVRDLMLDARFIDFDNQGGLIGAELRHKL